MNVKQKRILIVLVLAFSVLFVVTFVSLYPYTFVPTNGGNGGELPIAPVLEEIIPSVSIDGTVDLDWNDVPDAVNYAVYRSSNGISFTVLTYFASESSYNDLISYGGIYTYKITAGNVEGDYSGYSNTRSVTVAIPPSAPELNLISPTTDDDGFINLQWSFVNEATSYKLEMSKDGAEWVSIITTDTTYIWEGLSNGVYSFKVRSYNAIGYSTYSNVRTVTVSITVIVPLTTPVLVSIFPDPDFDGSIYLQWSSVSEATGYKLEMSKNYGAWISVITTATSYTWDGLTNGNYRFQVRASDTTRTSSYSDIRSVVVQIPEIPDTPILRLMTNSPSTDGEIRLEWDLVSGATMYTIDRSKDGGSVETLNQDFSENYYSDLVSENGVYSYKVKAGNSEGYSGFSNEESITVSIAGVPNSPLIDLLTYDFVDEGLEVQLNWSEVDCNSYNIYRSINNGNYTLIEENVFSTNYFDVLTETDIWLISYRVSAVNTHGESNLSTPRSIDTTQEGEPLDYTMLYILLGVLGILIVPMAIILVKRRKR